MRILIRSFWLVAIALITMSKAREEYEALQSVLEGSNRFSSAFYQAITQHKPGNLIISPLSAGVVLAMAAFGARANTEVQFRELLHLPPSDSVSTFGYQSIIDDLNEVKDNKLAVASKVFLSASFNLKAGYADLTDVYFRSSAQLVNFTHTQEAAEIINGWVEQSTNNLITEIITADKVDVTTRIVLINAVYFKGHWKNKFDPKLTSNMPFHTSKVEVKNVPTMYRKGNYIYGVLRDLDAKFVVIPYKGDELSMVIILPNEIDGLSDVEKKLQNTSLTNILSRGYEQEIELWLPKFKLESMLELTDILKEMGLTDAFTSRANFSGIADGSLYVNDVIQKAYIEINEEGSEAAAATGLTFVPTSYQIPPPTPMMKIDRPFFYDIYKTQFDDLNVVMLYSGHINDP